MLNKLMKYELRATAPAFFAAYAALLVASGMMALNLAFFSGAGQNHFENTLLGLGSAATGLFGAFYGAVFVGLLVLTVVVCILRFAKNLLGAPGYLMNTLPVEPWRLILSKYLSGMVWIAGTIVVSSTSLVILSAGINAATRATGGSFGLDLWGNLCDLIRVLAWDLEVPTPVAAILFVLLIVAVCSFFVLRIYLSILAGSQLARFRIPAALGVYFLIGRVVSFFQNFLLGLDLWNLEGVSDMPIYLCVQAAFAAACFAGCVILLKNHLNLD